MTTNGINLKVRLKNKLFWVTFIPITLTFIYNVLGLFGIVPTISEGMIENILLSIVSGLASLGVLVDPTTQGVSDSKMAMTYSEPKPTNIY